MEGLRSAHLMDEGLVYRAVIALLFCVSVSQSFASYDVCFLFLVYRILKSAVPDIHGKYQYYQLSVLSRVNINEPVNENYLHVGVIVVLFKSSVRG